MLIVYGGSFNPPTIAHFMIAKELLYRYPNAKLVFLPTGNSYHKEEMASDEDRFNMISLVALKLGNRVSCSRFELDQKEYKGTYYSLEHFKGGYYVIGADNLSYIDKWINYPDIIIKNKFIIIPRPGYEIEEIFTEIPLLKQYQKNFIILDDFPKLDISSTTFRNIHDKELVIEEVYQYIVSNSLYQI